MRYLDAGMGSSYCRMFWPSTFDAARVPCCIRLGRGGCSTLRRRWIFEPSVGQTDVNEDPGRLFEHTQYGANSDVLGRISTPVYPNQATVAAGAGTKMHRVGQGETGRDCPRRGEDALNGSGTVGCQEREPEVDGRVRPVHDGDVGDDQAIEPQRYGCVGRSSVDREPGMIRLGP